MSDTIFALSTGKLPSGIAIIRLSGPKALYAVQTIIGQIPKPRYSLLSDFSDPTDGSVIDKGIVVVYPGPASFTGEDVAEFCCHGGKATVQSFVDALLSLDDFRLAEPGEFSRRAFENGKMDLTELEGLSDLISSETESQRKVALNQSSGSLRYLYDDWRNTLIKVRALVEASIDFSDEEDVSDDVDPLVWPTVRELIDKLNIHLDDGRRGEIIRDGFRVALVGPPNSGKSSLLNALARREVAIVTGQAGTTRDVLSVSLDIDGDLIIVSDTAGLRNSDDLIEIEGMRRSVLEANQADLAIWLSASNEEKSFKQIEGSQLVISKSDLLSNEKSKDLVYLNTVDYSGLDDFIHFLKEHLSSSKSIDEAPIITRTRHRTLLTEALEHLIKSLDNNLPIELRSEELRIAADNLGRLCGRIDIEDLLDVIFSEFCVGK